MKKCVEAIAANAVIAVIIEEAVICAAVSLFGYVFSVCVRFTIKKKLHQTQNGKSSFRL